MLLIMNSCDNCGKAFKYPYLLLRHLNRKYQCSPIKSASSFCNLLDKKCNPSVIPENNKHTCEVCKMVFSHRQNLYRHKKNVNCSSLNEVEELKKKVSELEKRISKPTSTTTNNNNITNNNYAPIYNITYVKEKGVMICDNMDMEQNEMLCMEGFQRETCLNFKINNMDYEKLDTVTMNLINNEAYDEFFKFIFRDDQNRRLHFLNLGQNVGATACKTFSKGKVEKIEKQQLFDRIMSYLACLLTVTNHKYHMVNELLFTKKSKRSFENTLREPSEHFELFLEHKND